MARGRDIAGAIGGAQRRPGCRSRPRGRFRRWRVALWREVWGIDGAAVVAPVTRATVLRLHLLPLALYALLTAIVTYPLIFHLRSRIISFEGDALMNLWGYWWAREALLGGHNPYETPLLYAPYGAPLYLHTLNLANGIFSLPVGLLFGTTAAYNFVVFLSLILAAYFAYLLVAHISGDRAAGLVGGVAYAFGAYHLTHLLDHANLISSGWLPAYLLCLLRALDAGGRRRTGWAALAIGALVLLTLTDWLYVLFAVGLTAIIAPWHAVARRSAVPLAVAAAIGLPWLLLATPLLLATAAEVRSGITELPTLGVVRTYSADLVSWVIPSTRHWLFGELARRVERESSAPFVEGDIFLGFVPLALALYAAFAARRRAALWLAVAAIFFVLALGPNLHVNGAWRFGAEDRAIPLPYLWLYDLPGLSVARTPVRMSLVVALAVAILGGLGLAALFGRWPALGRGRARAALVTALIAILLAEQLTIPYPLRATAVPDFYHQLAASDEPGAVLEWPISYKRARSNLYQTVHGRPIMPGYIARRLAYPIRNLPPMGGATKRGLDILEDETPPNLAPHVLAWCGVRWIVTYRDEHPPEADVAEFVAVATDGIIHEEPALTAYRPRQPEGTATTLIVGPGWYDLERLADGKTNMRWFERSASFYAWHFGSPSTTVALRFDAWSFGGPRRLEVLLDGQSLGQWRVAETQRFDIPLTLSEGEHRIELRALDPPISPAAAGLSAADTRPLAFAIWRVSFQR
jgi:hypothetical protein